MKNCWLSVLMVTGSVCTSFLTQNYQLPVLDTMFIRKKYRSKDFGLHMLEDFVDSFTEDALGLRYPLSSLMYTGKLIKLKMLNMSQCHFGLASAEYFKCAYVSIK